MYEVGCAIGKSESAKIAGAMSVNLTEFVEVDALQRSWELRGWWTGWIGERVHVLPMGDSEIHISPHCRCVPHNELINGTIMQVHNSFDNREQFET
jgi:hypothetical protein